MVWIKFIGTCVYFIEVVCLGLGGQFNSPLENCFFLVIDEVDIPKAALAELRNMVTAKNHAIHNKGEKVYSVPNRLRAFLTTNNDISPISLSSSDRRVSYSVSRKQMLTDEEKEPLIEALKDARVLRLLYDYFLQVEVDENYNFQRNRVFSSDYSDLADSSLSQELRFIREFVEIGQTDEDAPVVYLISELYEKYRIHVRACGLSEDKMPNMYRFVTLLLRELDVKSDACGEKIGGSISYVSALAKSECGILYLQENHRGPYRNKRIFVFSMKKALSAITAKINSRLKLKVVLDENPVENVQPRANLGFSKENGGMLIAS